MAHKETMISWLNDAHALEHNLIQVLEHRVKDTRDHPQMQAMVQQHLEQTRLHADLVKGCIERLGSQPSSLKTGMANIIGTVKGMPTGPASDEMVKNALADYSAEQFEIASYTSLIAAAETLGDLETARICQSILQDEQVMASFLAQQIPIVTQEYLGMQAMEHGAA